MSLLQAADFAFMGKSLPPHHGGQNPIEPVALRFAISDGGLIIRIFVKLAPN